MMPSFIRTKCTAKQNALPVTEEPYDESGKKNREALKNLEPNSNEKEDKRKYTQSVRGFCCGTGFRNASARFCLYFF